jgi:carbon-monoxide dehydrogenase medium subunit
VNAFDYRSPRSLDEVLALLAQHGDDARVIAGGTALVTMMRQRLVRPEFLISLRDVKGLAGIEASKGELRAGAATTHREMEVSPLVKERAAVLAETYRRVATVRIRHMATVGGSLAHADPNQDPPVTLLALDARAEIQRTGAKREVPLTAFFRDYYETVLEPGELVTAVSVPPLPAASGAAYVKFLPRSAEDYATVAVAAVLTLEAGGERIRAGRIALGSVGPTPLRSRAAEALLAGGQLDDRLLRAVGDAAKSEVNPLSDHRGSAEYKREMTAVIVGRALTQAWEAARRTLK